MNLRTKPVFTAALFACAILVGSATANAQVVFRGTVALANETHWSNAVLEPGTYEVRVERLVRGGSTISIYRPGKLMSILAGPAEPIQEMENGKLALVHVNGVDVVREFDAGRLGESFTFQLPKAARMEAMHKTPTDVPVDATH